MGKERGWLRLGPPGCCGGRRDGRRGGKQTTLSGETMTILGRSDRSGKKGRLMRKVNNFRIQRRNPSKEKRADP